MNFTPDTNLTLQLHQAMPYALFIGLNVGTLDNEMAFYLPAQNHHIGNTIRTSLHGGLLGGLMESCAQFFVHKMQERDLLPQTININIDYLRPGKPEDAYIVCKMIKAGSRISSVWVEVWQRQREKPVTSARVLVSLTPC